MFSVFFIFVLSKQSRLFKITKKVEETQNVVILLNVHSCFHDLIKTRKLFLKKIKA